jgi:MoaA/NifB/PqqE/SkfB family radical SAM enzyme
MKNMENFKKLKTSCYLDISLVVDKRNAAHIYEFIKRAKEAGIESIKISACVVSNSGIENNAYHKQIYDTVKEQVARAVADFAGEDFEIADAYHLLEEKFKKDYTWCPYLQILPVIGADLNIYPCQDKAYNLEEGLMGSIKNIRFKDFWFSGKNKFFKINPALHCNHHCVANAKNKLILEYLEADKGHLEFV